MNLLNLDDAPEDPIRRLAWLSGVREQALAELEVELAEAYFSARLEGRLPAAIQAGPYSMKQALRLTRNENNKQGRMVRWGDGLDATSRRS